MKLNSAFTFALFAQGAVAQVAEWGQCGGTGYGGSKTCASGSCCTYSNAYYSQCLPCSGGGGGGGGGGSPTTTAKQQATTTKPSNSAATTFCGQYDEVTASNYYIINNLWGKSAATSGSECSFYNGRSGSGVSWGTTWTWAGGQYNVKSYPHAGLTFTPKIISQISSMPSTYNWGYSGNTGVCDVSYDLFTASSPNNQASSGEYEMMIWLAYYGGAGPITSSGQPIATPTIAGHSWKLYYGLNGSMKVYSFLSATNPLTSFSGDIKQFFTYLQQSQGFPASSQYLNTFQGGTEPFTGGQATLQVSTWSAAVN